MRRTRWRAEEEGRGDSNRVAVGRSGITRDSKEGGRPDRTGDSDAGGGSRRHAGVLARDDGVWAGHRRAANWRVTFLRLPGEDPWPLVNPEIIERSKEKIVVWDACLSFLSIFMQVERHREITVRYQDLRGEWQEVQAGVERNLSELLQHEIDHLNGILAVDRITDIRTMCTREEFEKRYRAESPYAVAGSNLVQGAGI